MSTPSAFDFMTAARDIAVETAEEFIDNHRNATPGEILSGAGTVAVNAAMFLITPKGIGVAAGAVLSGSNWLTAGASVPLTTGLRAGIRFGTRSLAKSGAWLAKGASSSSTPVRWISKGLGKSLDGLANVARSVDDGMRLSDQVLTGGINNAAISIVEHGVGSVLAGKGLAAAGKTAWTAGTNELVLVKAGKTIHTRAQQAASVGQKAVAGVKNVAEKVRGPANPVNRLLNRAKPGKGKPATPTSRASSQAPAPKSPAQTSKANPPGKRTARTRPPTARSEKLRQQLSFAQQRRAATAQALKTASRRWVSKGLKRVPGAIGRTVARAALIASQIALNTSAMMLKIVGSAALAGATSVSTRPMNTATIGYLTNRLQQQDQKRKELSPNSPEITTQNRSQYWNRFRPVSAPPVKQPQRQQDSDIAR